MLSPLYLIYEFIIRSLQLIENYYLSIQAYVKRMVVLFSAFSSEFQVMQGNSK